MRIIQVKNQQEMSQQAASYLIERVKENPHAILGLATGSTPKGTYKDMIEDHVKYGTSYANIKTLNLDEYVGVPKENKNSYHYFMKENLFKYLDMNEDHHYIPDGMASDLEQACRQYDQLIDENQMDIQLLGIGQNGHIGFNEPGTPFEMKTHIVELTHSTRKANARFFNSIHEVPTHAITMGIASILQSREILLLASGYKKAEAMKKLIMGYVDEHFPASALKMHEHVTVIADSEALSLVSDFERSVRYHDK